ncbi:MAG: hypothetical protein JWL67_745, partial [Solirubrobacterales bacterium]|nr:hypothetical protein [Solirubrobacterales bacterium]
MPATKPHTRDPALAGAAENAPPLAFASTRGLSLAELNQAPVRWPCPSRLQAPLRISAKKMAAGMRALGLET